MHMNMMYMERVEVDAHTMYIHLRIGNRILVRMDIFSSSYISISIIYGGLAHFMYILKEAIHGNRHADYRA